MPSLSLSRLLCKVGIMIVATCWDDWIEVSLWTQRKPLSSCRPSKACSFLSPFPFSPPFFFGAHLPSLLVQRPVTQVPAPFSRIHLSKSFGPGSPFHSVATPSLPGASCSSPVPLHSPLSTSLAQGVKNSSFSEPPPCLRREV